jgi:4a-hydroxytetrahydrobiopterin dehydratase
MSAGSHFDLRARFLFVPRYPQPHSPPSRFKLKGRFSHERVDFELIEVTLMTEQLADKKCIPCRGGVPPLKGSELEKLHRNIPTWTVAKEHHLHREFKFPDFKQALDFVNRVGALAEEEGHHPDILLAWGKAEITLWTHKIDGLTESDFIMAAKIDRANGE